MLLLLQSCSSEVGIWIFLHLEKLDPEGTCVTLAWFFTFAYICTQLEQLCKVRFVGCLGCVQRNKYTKKSMKPHVCSFSDLYSCVVTS